MPIRAGPASRRVSSRDTAPGELFITAGREPANAAASRRPSALSHGAEPGTAASRIRPPPDRQRANGGGRLRAPPTPGPAAAARGPSPMAAAPAPPLPALLLLLLLLLLRPAGRCPPPAPRGANITARPARRGGSPRPAVGRGGAAAARRTPAHPTPPSSRPGPVGPRRPHHVPRADQ